MKSERKIVLLRDVWKYKTVSIHPGLGEGLAEVTVWYNDDGSINETMTYSSHYMIPPPLPSVQHEPPPIPYTPPESYYSYVIWGKKHSDSHGDSLRHRSIDDVKDYNNDEDLNEDDDSMYYEFTACRVSGDGNAMFPDRLIITDDCVIYRKGRVIGYKEITIKLNSIGSVSLDKHLLFADIVIETNGGRTITARGFSRSDANMIVYLLE